LPLSVANSTIKVASLLAAGQAATGAISVKVAALTEGVMKAMFFNKLKSAVAVVLMLGFLATGTTLLAYRTAAGQDDKKLSKLATGKPELDIKASKPVEPAGKQVNGKLAPSPDDVFTAWGKEINGLQGGLGIRAGDVRAYHPGDTVTLSIQVRNNGKETVKFEYLRQFFMEMPPIVTDGAGKQFPRVRIEVSGEVHWPVEVSLAPGKEIELYQLKLELKPGNKVASGTVSIQYERLFGNTGAGQIQLDPALSKLGTGKLELIFESEPPPAKKKDAFTAWGKEVGGMQVGLGFRAGEHRAYHIGETVTLAVRVRNVGKQDTNLEYMREYLQNSPPRIIDDEGRPYPTPTIINDFGEQTPVRLTLAPGKESELYTLKLVLRPISEKQKRNVMEIYGMGNFQIQETGLVGNSWTGTTRIGTAFSGMFTGKLELEVKDGLSPRPRPKDPEDADPESKRLTPQQARKLLPKAASLRYEDFETGLKKRKLPNANQSPTYFVLTFAPSNELPKDADKDFDWIADTINPNAVAEALAISKDSGFASIIQERYITECTCESDDQQAQGRVKFKCDLYTGSMSFKATNVKGDWVIREFEWPHLGVRFIRGDDGNWKQDKIRR
jgi:hypothetical protein